MRLSNRIAVLFLFFALLALAAGCSGSRIAELESPRAAVHTSAAVSTVAPASVGTAPANSTSIPVTDLSSAIRDVAQRVRPAVVQITNEQVQIDQFNQPYTVPAGVGSGVIYDAQGHILTNNHVVEGAQQLLVTLPDGRSFPAKLVGRDPQTDLAVVQITGTNLPVAELGDSGTLQVGDWVVAIGNALALDGGPTVTAGVVSALGRTVQEPGDSNTSSEGPYLFDVIQTDAPINPGNSGGPLVNLAGQVVGINTMVAGNAEPGVQAEGIGFAISISSAKPIASQLVATGRVVHPSFGISYVPLSPAISARLGIKPTDGVLIERVSSGSPAAEAGIQRGDVITEIDGNPLQNDSALPQAMSTYKPGDHLKLTVLRGNQTLSMEVTLGEMQAP